MDRVVRPEEVRQCVFIDPEALACVTGAFSRQVQGRAGPSRGFGLALPAGGTLRAHARQVDGLYSLATRLACEAPGATPPEDRHALLLTDPEGGAVQALLLDGGYLGWVGRALAGALACKALACDPAPRVGVLGPDPDAGGVLAALALVRDLEAVQVAGAPTALGELPGELAGSCKGVGSAADAAAGAQVLLASPAGLAALTPELLHPGVHVLTWGPEAPAPAVLAACDMLACDEAPGSPLRGRTAGELVELGRLAAGWHPGRASPEQVTLADVGPSPLLDSALAFLAWRKSQKYKLGVVCSDG